jgi:pimeloyl-ACP methyl ester carboxylesterase
MNDQEIRLTNVEDGEVVVTVDRPTGEPVGSIVLVPPFGMSAERMFPAAYLLTLNGFEVYRFDPRYHPGRSTGSIETFKLSGLPADVAAILDLVPGAVVVGISLSARAVIRALAGRTDWGAAVLLTPVVNVRFTLEQVFGYDLFARIYGGEGLPPRVRVFGYDVDTSFIQDCIEHRMVDVRDASIDLGECRRPFVLVAGDADPWVKLEEVRRLANEARERGRTVELVSVQAASHQLYRNPVLAMTYFQTATRECMRLVGRDPQRTICPPFSEIITAVEDATASIRPARPERSRV